jgi:hypothetical protein
MRGDNFGAPAHVSRQMSVFLVWDLVDRQSRDWEEETAAKVQNCCSSRCGALAGHAR